MENIQTTAEFLEENNTATEEDKKFFEQMDYFSTYGKGFGAQTVWSIYDEGILFGNDHPFGENVVIRHKCDVFGPDGEQKELDGITQPGDTVKGFLTQDDLMTTIDTMKGLLNA